jgi:hypothetical protein
VIALLLAALVAGSLSGCTKPRLDTSSERDFRISLAAVKEKLPADAREQLDAALELLRQTYPNTSAQPDDAGALSPRLSAMLQGKTGRQVIGIAAELKSDREARRQKAETLKRERERRSTLRELQALRAKVEAFDLETLKRVRVIDAHLVAPAPKPTERERTSAVRDWFKVETPSAPEQPPDPSELPSLALTLESELRSGIFGVLFEVQLMTADSTEPWLTFETKQRFSHGLFYGQSTTRQFVPEAFFDAFPKRRSRRTPDPDTLVVLARPTRLYGPDGKTIAGADLTDAELARVETLLETLAETGSTGAIDTGKSPTVKANAEADDALLAQIAAINRWRRDGIAEAFRAKLRGLHLDLQMAEEAHEPFSRFLIENVRFRWSDNPVHRKPVLTMRVRNQTGEPISRCHVRGTLTSADRERPWVDTPMVHRFREPLAPGQTRDVRIVPNWLGAWGAAPKDRDDLDLELKLTRLDGPDQKDLFAYAFPDEKLERLQALEAFIADQGW